MAFTLYGREFQSRLLLGTARYPSLQALKDAILVSEAEVITLSLRRQSAEPGLAAEFWQSLSSLGRQILPNTAGCQTAKEAILLAEMARSLFATPWIKLEVTCDDYSLAPDCLALVEAAKELLQQGFEVFPYCTEDLGICEHLASLGCKVIMPWASAIGSGKGIANPSALKLLRQRLKEQTLIVDAGIGAPSHASLAMELGFDGVLLNTAVALADDPVTMARAFARGIEAGRLGYEAGLMPSRDFASPSTPLLGRPFAQAGAKNA